MTTRAPTPREAFFFLTIMQCMKNKPDVDWDLVATRAGYSNARSAKVRFGQIKKAIGATENGSPASSTPTKGSAKKDSTIGSGTNTTPSKVTKPRTPRKPKAAKVKPEPEPEAEAEAEEQDYEIVKDEIDELAEGGDDDAYEFESPLHEKLFKNYQMGQYDDDEVEVEDESK
ncbi:uncharacterized protein RSE6_09707 [Rhynchosporium secalis]|uniref:Myb-like DNA-binding domain-containing protein n=1 Tax=Rhynchosporium secalis TaxID=38038 RepID=A0A1E1MIP5_RHYSE|nr:uncharacterized protein RSE6_09707 [Rhynchosporium secalis]